MEYRWAGALTLTQNSVPAFGELAKGVYAACACNGLGLTKATASGIAAAECLLGQSTELTRIYQSLPPQPFLTIGERANIRYRTWTTGDE